MKICKYTDVFPKKKHFLRDVYVVLSNQFMTNYLYFYENKDRIKIYGVEQNRDKKTKREENV